MDKPANRLAEQLLEHHVQHELDALTDERFAADMRTEVDELFGLCKQLTLKDVVSQRQIKAVIKRNVVDLEIHGGIPELAGEMAARVKAAPVQKKTRLKDLGSRTQAAEFAEAVLALRRHRERLVEKLLEHPLYQELVAEIVYHGVINYVYDENLFSKNMPGMAATMKLGRQMFSKAVSGLDVALEKNLKAYIARSLPFLVRQSQLFINGALSDEELRDSVMAFWAMFEDKTIAELQLGLGDLELDEFIVLGYEFWQGFRKTDYFKGCYETVVDHLFRKYGNKPLQMLIGDMGVTPAIVKTELEAFAPALLGALRKHGYLEQMLRRRLEPFYRSEATLRLLDEQPKKSGSRSTAAAKPEPKPEPKPKPKPKPKPEAKTEPGSGKDSG